MAANGQPHTAGLLLDGELPRRQRRGWRYGSHRPAGNGRLRCTSNLGRARVNEPARHRAKLRLSRGGVRPAQLVVGTGGDNLEGMPEAPVAGADINGAVADRAVTYSGFGYMIWDRVDATTWTGTLFDTEAKPLNHCRLSDRALSCGS